MDPVISQAIAAAPPFVNWQINVWDLVLIGATAVVLYSRLTTLETKITPIWAWWNSNMERRATHERELT